MGHRWLAFFFKKEHFLLDSLFSLHFPKLFKTVYQARGFLGARVAACLRPCPRLVGPAEASVEIIVFQYALPSFCGRPGSWGQPLQLAMAILYSLSSKY